MHLLLKVDTAQYITKNLFPVFLRINTCNEAPAWQWLKEKPNIFTSSCHLSEDSSLRVTTNLPSSSKAGSHPRSISYSLEMKGVCVQLWLYRALTKVNF